MRAVLDTNVLVSATLVRGGNEDRILRAWKREAFELVLSRPILQEFSRALFYEKFRQRRWMSEQEIRLLLELIAAEGVLVPGKIAVKASRDPHDDKFLAAALEAEARYVVSGDKDLLAIGAYRGIEIVSPARFLKILREAETG